MAKYIDKVISDAKARGYDVRIRDVGYAILCAKLDDANMAYLLIFGDDGNFDTFVQIDRIKYLVSYFKSESIKEKEKDEAAALARLIAKSKGKNSDESGDNMTFEENRAGIEAQIKEVLSLKEQLFDENGKCTDMKTMGMLQKVEIDARAKLNDKFGASEKTTEQYIIVQPKFNHICEHTRRECWLQTKEYAKEHWHLIDDPDYKGDNE